jgi:hypothetical protein
MEVRLMLRIPYSLVAIALVCLVAVGAVDAAAILTVPDASFYEVVDYTNSHLGPGTLTETTTNSYGTATSTATAAATLAGGVSASGSANVPVYPGLGPVISALSSSIIYFEVIGPTSFRSVTLDISATVSSSASSGLNGSGGGGAVIYWTGYYQEDPVGTNREIDVSTSSTGGVTTSTSYDAGVFGTASSVSVTASQFTGFTGYYGYVSLEATGGSDYGTVSSDATADPVITIDPTWLAANPGYSLVFSPNLTVPEPGTWMMVLIGFAGLGFVGYSRSKKNTTLGPL